MAATTVAGCADTERVDDPMLTSGDHPAQLSCPATGSTPRAQEMGPQKNKLDSHLRTVVRPLQADPPQTRMARVP